MLAIVAGHQAVLIGVATSLFLPTQVAFVAAVLSLAASVSSAAILASKRGPAWLRVGADIAIAPTALLGILALDAWDRRVTPSP